MKGAKITLRIMDLMLLKKSEIICSALVGA